MSTLIVASLLITGTLVLSMLFVFISKQNIRKRTKARLKLLLAAGAKRDLIFSKMEILESKIIGLDEVNKTLLIYEFKNGDNFTEIQLVKVRTCALKKRYKTINMGNEKKAELEQQLAGIDIIVGFKHSGDEPLSISFYDSDLNNIYEMASLEEKAKHWEEILSTIVSNKFSVSTQSAVISGD